MLKKIVIALLVVSVLIVISLLIALNSGISFTITESEIQSAIYKKFPMEKTHLIFLRVEYTDPIVELIDNTERVRIGITVSPFVEINGKRHSGSVVVDGGFKYEPGLGQVFLTGFQVEKLQLDGYKSIPLDKLSDAISHMLEEVYSKHPIYTLGGDLKQRTAKMLVRDVKIRNKSVTILLGP